MAGFFVLVFDVTKERASVEALRDSEELFALFMQHLPGAAWIKDKSGRYVFVNAMAECTFGRAAADCLGRTDDELFPPEAATQFKLISRR